MSREKIKRGWSPIPAFSHREPPFCVAAICYLFFAPFLAPPFFAPPFFLAPPFFAVAILCSPFVKILPCTQDNVALLLLYTSVNVIQHIVVYICFAHSCQLFFSSRSQLKRRIGERSLKVAARASFKPAPRAGYLPEGCFRATRVVNETKQTQKSNNDVIGSQSRFCGSGLETGSGSQFRDTATKLAPVASFAGFVVIGLGRLTALIGGG